MTSSGEEKSQSASTRKNIVEKTEEKNVSVCKEREEKVELYICLCVCE